MPPGLQQVTKPLFDWLENRQGARRRSPACSSASACCVLVFLLPGGFIAGMRKLRARFVQVIPNPSWLRDVERGHRRARSRSTRRRTCRTPASSRARDRPPIHVAGRRPRDPTRGGYHENGPLAQAARRGVRRRARGGRVRRRRRRGSDATTAGTEAAGTAATEATTATEGTAATRRRPRPTRPPPPRRPRRPEAPEATEATTGTEEGAARRPTAPSRSTRPGSASSTASTRAPATSSSIRPTAPRTGNPTQGITDTEITLFIEPADVRPAGRVRPHRRRHPATSRWSTSQGGIDGRKIVLDGQGRRLPAGQDEDERRRGARRELVRRRSVDDARHAEQPGRLGRRSTTSACRSCSTAPARRSGVTSRTTRGRRACSSTTSPRPACGPSGCRPSTPTPKTVAAVTFNNDFGKSYAPGFATAIKGTDIKVVDAGVPRADRAEPRRTSSRRWPPRGPTCC